MERVDKQGKGAWHVRIDNGEERSYRGLVIANGHHWSARMPDYPGKFHGRILHARHYKTPDLFRGQRVLVVGAGNSGCDIAIEAAQNADRTLLSLRRGYHFIPKYLFGKPADQVGEVMLKLRLPLFLMRAINTWTLRLWQGTRQTGELVRRITPLPMVTVRAQTMRSQHSGTKAQPIRYRHNSNRCIRRP